ncbi:Phosducin-like protein 2 [Erysiphe necator]|uniref:Putative phosducin family protein n=1 Tax=Uncinula necator TaxID=52586 RepID=A0A0B1PAW6_UNCNE|nr:Phosducin-like protein 2 [Erysiphe necator]KHJ34500.1 putative phosducin family protein [Erysiphe necator]
MSAPFEERVSVPIDDPNADTEWNDILRKHGIIPQKPPSPTLLVEEAILESRRLAHENRLEGKDLDELDELEDLEDEEFLATYRQQRMREIQKLYKKSIHGTVYPITKPDYSREVTDASTSFTVLVLLTSTNVESRKLSELWKQIACKYPEMKFCEMRAEMAIEGYPERNCPTILIYKEREILRQVVSLKTLGGLNVQVMDIENLLLDVGVIVEDSLRTKSNKNE